MNLINKRITEIVAGYDLILQAETELRSHWRAALITTYVHRREKYDRSQSGTPAWEKTHIFGCFLGLSLLLIGLGFSCAGITQENTNLLLFCCGGPLLALLGILIFGAAGLSHFSGSKDKPRHVPLHPLRGGPLKKGIFPNLRQSWMQGMVGELIDEISDHPEHLADDEVDFGAEGERHFVQRLGEVCSEADFFLARTMQHPNEDVDLILVGPKGVWVFEVKHWSGEIYWDDKGWRRVQTYFERGGIEVTQEVEVGEPPDQQWNRAASEVKRTLQHRIPEVLKRYPSLSKVRGGLVFTHEGAALKVQAGRPSFWGSLPFWVKTLNDFEPIADLDTRSTLQILEALLERHYELAPAEERRSMLGYAQSEIQDTEEKLNQWVQG
jgi:hypothetical protein